MWLDSHFAMNDKRTHTNASACVAHNVKQKCYSGASLKKPTPFAFAFRVRPANLTWNKLYRMENYVSNFRWTEIKASSWDIVEIKSLWNTVEEVERSRRRQVTHIHVRSLEWGKTQLKQDCQHDTLRMRCQSLVPGCSCGWSSVSTRRVERRRLRRPTCWMSAACCGAFQHVQQCLRTFKDLQSTVDKILFRLSKTTTTDILNFHWDWGRGGDLPFL